MRKATGSYRTYSSLVKLQPRILSLQWKTCLWAELQPRYLLIHSMQLYGCEAWSILAKCHKKKIQILQNKCLKIIFQAPRYTRISELHDMANFPYIDELMEDRAHKMYHMVSAHDNPLVQTVGHLYQ